MRTFKQFICEDILSRVEGNTAGLERKLHMLGAHWNGIDRAWYVPQDRLEQANKLVQKRDDDDDGDDSNFDIEQSPTETGETATGGADTGGDIGGDGVFMSAALHEPGFSPFAEEEPFFDSGSLA